eukprot:gb/GFBE01006619.1/.p1 GENE.gb/GFBE01006619.1/~~gb/GFBE01006619.1/.p1  ORF type:complete len:422 (+),score=80.39 gb/GFBE01006619.1/:1-1266(+)
MAVNAREYLNIEDRSSDEAESEVPVPTRKFGRGAAASVLAGLGLVAAATYAGRWKVIGNSEVESYILGEYDVSNSQCGTIDNNTDYVDYSGWGKSLDHIPDPEMCCAFCQAEPKCKSFVWVADAGLPGCPSACYLKGGKPVEKKSKQGVVAGIPPPRNAWRQTMQEPPPDEYPLDQTGLFCFSLMLPKGYETELLAWQFVNQASIFACDKYAVYTNVSMEVGRNTGLFTRVVDSDLHCELGGDSYSALNAWIFIAVWKRVLDDGYWREYPWTVKADPDAVFFPGRLRPLLPQYYGQPYINNCRYGMHGPLEVLGKPALAALAEDYARSADGKAPKNCVEELHFGLWGEDMFLNQCLVKVLGVTGGADPLIEPKLMCEDHCDCKQYYWCKNGSDRVSFHPFKSVDSYQNCMANAEAQGSLSY